MSLHATVAKATRTMHRIAVKLHTSSLRAIVKEHQRVSNEALEYAQSADLQARAATYFAQRMHKVHEQRRLALINAENAAGQEASMIGGEL